METRGVEDFEMDMNISEVSLASFIGETANDYSGFSVSMAGDVNGDGFDDILIGAWRNDEGGLDAGQTYLILGKSSGWSMDTDLSNADASFIGEGAGDLSGHSVSGAGDVNGDGYDDMLIGAFLNDEGGTNAGQTYLILGKSSGWSLDTDLSNIDASFIGENANDDSGRYISGAGDVNDDGYDDFLIASTSNCEGGIDAGQTYLILGKSSGWSMDTDLGNSDASFIGEKGDDLSGFSVSGAGDVNGDGFDDILIGAQNNGEGGTYAGQTYLIFGKSSGWSMDTDLSNANSSFIGENDIDSSGHSVSGVGDVNGDGFDDILIGAFLNSEGDNQAGQTYLFLGKTTGWSMDTDISTADASFIGEEARDYSGGLVSSAGDVNGDGFDDILISAHLKNESGTIVSQTYLILGKSSGWSMDTDLSQADASFIGDETYENAYFPGYVSGDGDVNGDGYPDILIGASKNDEGGNDAGQTYLLSMGNYSEPSEIYNIIITNEIGEELTVADKLDLVHIKISGRDSNSTSIDRARVNVTFSSTIPTRITLSLWETGLNTGLYEVSFIIPSSTEYLENIRFSAYIDQTKFKDVQVNTPIRIGPLMENINWMEDEFMEFEYKNLGYHLVDQWKMDTDANWLEWDDIEQKISGTPDNSMIGIYWANISASDGQGNLDWMNITIEVVNKRPWILNENEPNAYEDEFYEIDYECDDEGCGETLWSISPSYIEWLEFDPETGILSGIPTGEDVGSYFLNISVDDGNGGLNWTEFTLTVQDKNDPPIITTEPYLEIEQGNQYYVQFNAVDEDDINTYEWTMNTDARFLEINNQTGVLSGTPENDDVGVFFINVTCQDLRGETDWINFTLKVIDVNDAPEWINKPMNSQINQGETFSFKVKAVDIDEGDSVSYSISSRPVANISIDKVTGEISWYGSLDGLVAIPNYVLTVEIQATDGKEIIICEFSITVIPNPSPTSKLIRPINGNKIISEGIFLKWEGEDDDEISYDIYLGTSQAEVEDHDSNTLWKEDLMVTSIHTGVLERGNVYYWTVVPKDLFSTGTCSNKVFSFSVNILPYFNDPSVSEANVGYEFRLKLLGSDEDGDEIEFSIIEGPNGMELFDDTILWTPSLNQVGSHIINISLSDGYETIYEVFQVEVIEKEKVVESKEKDSAIVPIIIVIVLVLVLAGAGVGVFLFLKSKKEPETEEEKNEDDTPPKDMGSSEEEK